MSSETDTTTPIRPSDRPSVRLGFLPLLDSAPLLIAQTLGYYEQEGLDVRLEREHSWASVRDKVVFGLLDGAHMLAPLPIASTLGLGSVRKSMLTALSLGLNGNAVTLSAHLYQALQEISGTAQPDPQQTALALKTYLGQRQSDKPLTFATVFPFSMHHYQIRHWLGAAGIDPDRDVSLVVVPPAMMVSALTSGEINGFCVGEPYNALATRAGVGRIALTGYDIWPQAPEKVFGVTADWAQDNPDTHHRLLRALLRACQWLDEPENRQDLAAILSHPDYVGLSEASLSDAVTQMSQCLDPELPCTHKHFYRHGGTLPSPERARWIADQMLRWGQVDAPINTTTLRTIFRNDLYDEVASSLNLPLSHQQTIQTGPSSPFFR